MSAQKLESQHTGALERSQIIKDELILERQNNEELKYQLEEFKELLGGTRGTRRTWTACNSTYRRTKRGRRRQLEGIEVR